MAACVACFKLPLQALLYPFILPVPRDWLEWTTPMGSPALWDHPVGTSSMRSVRGRQQSRVLFFFNYYLLMGSLGGC